MTGWRIFKPRHAATAFTGDGARLFGGRWNSRGIAVIYTAGSQSLAALELLVHLASSEILETYQVAGVEFDEDLVEQLNPNQLSSDWRTDPAPISLKSFGDEWVCQARTAVLRVPSAIVPDEHNYLLNPAHPDFAKIKIQSAVSFRFDPRLAKT